MTTVIRVTCGECDTNIELGPADVNVLIVPMHPRLSTYAFRCNACDCCCVKIADRRVIDLLTAGGCRIEHLRMPAELNEPHPSGPLTADDLLDFALLLGETDLLAEVADLESQR